MTKPFPTFDDRQVSQLKSSFINNYRQYNPNEKPQNHVLIMQSKWPMSIDEVPEVNLNVFSYL
jgi:hypothetical protein